MKALRNYLPVLCAVFIAFLGGEATLAQNTPPAKGTNIKVERNVIIENGVVVEGDGPMLPRSPAPPPGGTFVFVSTEMSFGKIVKGAPYSAEAITETVQTLGDGNRIVNKSSASVYRDSEGRTRRDQTVGAIGPFAAAGDPPQTFFINDPVAGVNFILDPRSRTARKLPLPPFPPMAHGGMLAPGAKELKEKELKDKVKDKDKEETFTMMAPPPPGAPDMPGVPMFRYSHTDNENAKKESLGKQTIEGVQAEGMRLTVTIPAGEIGNEQPINMVTERWYSPELQLVVMSKHSDPRFGETTYRLTNISRNEPARSLFEVPSDYTVKDGGMGVRTFVRTPKPKEEK